MNKKSEFKKVRYLLTTLVWLLFPAAICGQQITISGEVTDTTGEPLIGASVIANENGIGVTTGLNGDYNVKANPQSTLTFSYVGYITQTVEINGRNIINITLQEDNQLLEELVVVGYGTMKKSDLTGAVSSLGNKDIKDVPVSNVGQAIQGKIAGVNIIDAAKPGDNVNIKIRGLGSINNCDPLVVIDGIPTDLGLNSLNPQDIERLDILKDASATAIYGSRGANGVVMITTRKGAAGTSKLSFSANMALQNAAKKMSLLNAASYASLSNDMMINSGNNPNPAWADPSSLGISTNWVNELLQVGLMQNYNVSNSGGNEKSHYYFSAGFFDQCGIVKGVNYRRFTFQSNNDSQVLKWLKLSNNLLFSTDIKKSGKYSIGDAMKALPTFPVKDENGEWSGPDGNSMWYGSIRNPVGTNEMYKSETHGYNLLANISGDLFLTEWLQFRSTFGYDMKLWDYESFSPKYNWKPIPVEESSYYQSRNKSFTYLWDNYFTINKTFREKHYVNFMLGTSAQWNSFDFLNSQMNGFLFDNVHQMDNGQKMYDIGGSKSQWSLMSYMARANYTYADRYLITATVRRDGSSRFGPKHRWGTFPSVSAAWKISGEEFFSKTSPINDLKLRLGYGQTGSQASVGNYSYLPSYNTMVYPLGIYSENQAALIAQTLSNPYIHWEEIEQYNVGVDFALLNSRITASIDGYIKNTNDMLVKASVPITSGFEDTSTTYSNAGKVRNIGWELSVHSVNLDKPLMWETDLAVTYNKNKIVNLNSDVPFYINEIGGAYATMLAKDYPINVFYGYVTDGIFQNWDEVNMHAIQTGAEPGDIRFRDLNNDGVINDRDRTIIGNPNPTWLFSLNNRFTYRGLELSFYFQGVAGNKIFNASKIDMTGMAAAYNQYASVAARWTGEGTSNDIPRAVYGDPNGNNRLSDRYVEDGSYIRLKNVTLAYNLPKSLLLHIGMEQARIAISAENLATVTSYTGFDPEVGVNGIDWSTFPSSRTYNFSLSLNF